MDVAEDVGEARLEPRRGVNRIAIGSVIEKATAAEISDQRGTGVDANSGRAEIHALGFPAFAKCLGPCIESVRAGDRACRIVRLIAGRVEQDLDRVADDLGDRAFMGKHNVGHAADIFVEQCAQHLGLSGFHQ